jgi:hypothetical protein
MITMDLDVQAALLRNLHGPWYWLGVAVLTGLGAFGLYRRHRSGQPVPRWIVPVFVVCVVGLVVLGVLRN